MGKTRLLTELVGTATRARRDRPASATASTSATRRRRTCRSARRSPGSRPPTPSASSELLAGSPAGRRPAARAAAPAAPRTASTAASCSRPSWARSSDLADRGAGAARHRGRALGRPGHPRPARLPVHPRRHRTPRDHRQLPQRRPAPPPPAASDAGRMGPAARGDAASQLDPLAADDVRSLVRAIHPEPLADAAVNDIVSRADGNAFFAEELVAAAEQCQRRRAPALAARRPAARPPRTALRRRPRGRPGRGGRRSPGRARPCSPRSSTCRPTDSTPRCAKRSTRTSCS